MSELISGKEAWIAKSEKINVQYRIVGMDWYDLSDNEFINWQTHRFLSEDSSYEFRLKPQTITLNGIEVPAPFKPKDGEVMYVLDNNGANGFYRTHFNLDSELHENFLQFGAWRTEEEIKQAVEALRSVFK